MPQATTGPVTGVVVALADEARPLSPRLKRARLRAGDLIPLEGQLLLAISGIGPERATRAADRLLEQGVAALASWGTAGGLDPKLPRAALVLPKCVIDGQGNRYAVDPPWRWRLEHTLTGIVPLASGPLLSSARPLVSAEQKAEAFERTAAIAVDMESAAVAARATAAMCPFMVVRTITDTAFEHLPAAALAAVDADGRFQPLLLLLALLRRPSDLPGLMKLGRHFSAARQTLAQTAENAPGLLATDDDDALTY
jgi:adenosylhomocysteine nucleosidase